jgi:YhcH/YjgK/YiaL family protein
MILDRIENWDSYFNKESDMYKGFRFITEVFNENTPDGRYDIIGSDVYAMVQSYNTGSPETKNFESHKKHIDIQYIFSGTEAIDWLPIPELAIMTPYSEEKDVIFYHPGKSLSTLILTKGKFAVFYPADAHRPCCFIDKPEHVRKILIKVRV